MNIKKLVSILLILLVFSIAVVSAYDVCFFTDGVTISKDGNLVVFENKADSYRTVYYTVVFTDGTKAEYEQYTVSAGKTERKAYSKQIRSVDPCW
jgi:hypothetical protein